eukprot:6197465-Pleurochrysis_carterae.AAC.1
MQWACAHFARQSKAGRPQGRREHAPLMKQACAGVALVVKAVHLEPARPGEQVIHALAFVSRRN